MEGEAREVGERQGTGLLRVASGEPENAGSAPNGRQTGVGVKIHSVFFPSRRFGRRAREDLARELQAFALGPRLDYLVWRLGARWAPRS
jgi:hypothetical protein